MSALALLGTGMVSVEIEIKNEDIMRPHPILIKTLFLLSMINFFLIIIIIIISHFPYSV
jgi:hypothetical protein